MIRLKTKQFRTIMTFEFMGYMHNKAYITVTIIFIVLLGIGLSIPSIISLVGRSTAGNPAAPGDQDPAKTIYVIDRTGLLADLRILENGMPQERWQRAEPDQLDDLRQLVGQNQAKAVLLIDSPVQYTYIEKRAGLDAMSDQLPRLLRAFFQETALRAFGLNDDQIGTVLAQPQLTHVETVEADGKTMGQTYFYTYLLLFLLYMTVMMYGQLVATSVASEKSNRAMELLITSARPLNLMFGKVIGSGLAGLAQIVLFIMAAGGFYILNRASWADIPFIRSVFQMPAEIVIYTLVFYLLGYFMYAFLYGALGSLASRTEDINTSIMPVLLVIMAAMFLSMFGMITPEATWLTVFSFVPFFSPMALFVRICMTDVPAWQIALSIALMVLTIAGTGWLSSRIYRLGVLMYGKPPRLRELLVLLRQAGR